MKPPRFLLIWCVTVVSAYAIRKSSVGENGDLKLRLENFDNVQYSAPFSLGSQTLPVIYDTGSFEIIVLSTLCPSCSQAHQVYDSSKSASFMAAQGVVAEHLFGSGPVRSQKGYETVRLGEVSSPYVAKQAPFWQVMSHGIEVWDRTAHFSGIVGLGHPGQVPEEFSPAGAEAEAMLATMHVGSFALCLERLPGAPGWLLLGPSVQALPGLGHFHTLRVAGHVHWAVEMTHLGLGGTPGTPGLEGGSSDPGGTTAGTFPSPCSPSCSAILDSGTSLLAAPPSAAGFLRILAQRLRRDCSNLRSLPALTMRLDGQLVQLPPSAYVVRTQTRVARNSSILRRLFTGSEYETVDQCSLGFMTLEKQSRLGPVWILGMPFLRHYFTVFDRVAKTIHIAPSSGTCDVLSTTPGAPVTGLFNASVAQTPGPGRPQAPVHPDPGAYEPTDVNPNGLRLAPWATAAESRVDL